MSGRGRSAYTSFGQNEVWIGYDPAGREGVYLNGNRILDSNDDLDPEHEARQLEQIV
jgi:hypothetical protein